MNDLDDDVLADRLGRIADEFTEALHRGERPDVEDYVRRHPEIASLLREVLPTLQVMRLPGACTFPLGVPADAAMPEVLGDYRLLREIGRGGMGIVYEAEQVSLKRRVALKVLAIHPALEMRYLARFEREAKTAAQLHHTNIVPVFAVGCAQGTHFYAMQLIDGQSLDHLLNAMRGRLTSAASLSRVHEEQAQQFAEPLCSTSGRVPSADGSRASVACGGYFHAVARMGLQVAEALDYAHQRGVVHRDIKPSNLILDDAGIVWVTDFGLVKYLDGSDGDNLTRTGDVLGTARYMSPEQALPKRGAVDPRSDLYSLGVTLYELLTLRPAFDGADPATLLRQIVDEEPPAPRQLHRAVPRDLETIVLRAMAKDPPSRYRTAAAVAADLRRYLAGEPIRARPRGMVEKVWRWTKRRPTAAALLAVIVLAVVGFIAEALRSNAELRAANERTHQRALEAEERERIGRRHRYAANIRLALGEWDRGHVDLVHDLLEEELPQPGYQDLRGFEWHYLWRLSHRERRSWPGHAHAISAVRFAGRNQFLATASYDRTIQLWEPATGRSLRKLTGHKGAITALVVAPNGRALASASQDRTLRLWDVETGKAQELRGHGGPVQAVAFSPDGRTLASGGADGSVCLWDVERRNALRTLAGHSGTVWAVAFSPDGRTLASGGADHSIRLWPVSADTDAVVLNGHGGDVRALAFAPGGQVLASGSGDQAVKLWDLNARKASATLKGHTDPVSIVAFSPDGRTLASGGGAPMPLDTAPPPAKSQATQLRGRASELVLWDVSTGQQRVSLRGHTGAIFGAAFSPDGGTLASGGEDRKVILWDVASVEARTVLPGCGDEVNSLAISPSDHILLTGGDDKTIRLWDLASGRELVCLRAGEKVKAVAWSPRGACFATGGEGNAVQIWDAGTYRELALLKGHHWPVRSLVFSPDGATLASVAGDVKKPPVPGEVRLWNVADGQERARLTGHTDAVRSVAYSPDGRTLATGSDDKSVKLWDAATGQERLTIDRLPYSVRSVAFSPDGATLAIACGGVWDAHEPGEVKLWDVPTRRERAALRGHRAAVMVVAFAPDGLTLATGSTDGTVKLWDPEIGQVRAVLEGHQGQVRSVAFAPDGKVLATADSDGLVRLWFGPRR
jgi:WD40 repeat protein/serine/threonine protein kinase